jgi:glucose-6-phosphate 1-dehydrogenase
MLPGPFLGALLAPPCAIAIFGAGGDLTKRLVISTLYNRVGAQRFFVFNQATESDWNSRPNDPVRP